MSHWSISHSHVYSVTTEFSFVFRRTVSVAFLLVIQMIGEQRSHGSLKSKPLGLNCEHEIEHKTENMAKGRGGRGERERGGGVTYFMSLTSLTGFQCKPANRHCEQILALV